MREMTKTCLTVDQGRTGTIQWRDIAVRAWRKLVCWHDRAQERRQLRELEPHLLDDIGLKSSDALHEAEKPFWKR